MRIVKMDSTDYERFRVQNTRELAKMRAREAGRDFSPEFLEAAQQEMQWLLPRGIATSDHFLYCIKNEAAEMEAWLWFAIRERNGIKKVFIYDIFVDEAFRGLGHGRMLLQWLEKQALALGLNEITLHVVATNEPALRLYQTAGYGVTNLYLSKKIE